MSSLDPVGSSPVERAEALLLGGRFEHALQLYADLLRSHPADPRVQHGLALSLKVLGDVKQAEPLLRAASQTTGDPEMLKNHGAVCLELGANAEAARSYAQALAAQPEDAAAAASLGEAYLSNMQFEEARAAGQHAARLDPNHAKGWYAAAMGAAQVCDLPLRERASMELWRCLEADLAASPRQSRVPLLGTMLLGAPAALQREMAERRARDCSRRKLPPPTSASKAGRLKVGYLSADLWGHAVGLLFAPFVGAHDLDRFEIHLFSLREVRDELQSELRSAVDGWHDLSAMDEDAAAIAIRNLGIDVLVDLGGFTGGARPGILGRRPCSVQLHWLGYPGTLGRNLVDGHITHRRRDPQGTEAAYDEPLLRVDTWLGTGGWTVRTPPPRSAVGLPEARLVYAYFSTPYRIDGPLLDAWTAILREVEGSILWLPDYIAAAQANLRKEFAARGLAPDRVVFSGTGKLSDDWRHQLADVWLDAFSPSGGTAGVLAAWAGVPVLTRSGSRPQDRTGAVIAELAGVPELIAGDERDYVETGIRLGLDGDRRRRIRDVLRSRNGGLFRPRTAAEELEALYLRLARAS